MQERLSDLVPIGKHLFFLSPLIWLSLLEGPRLGGSEWDSEIEVQD